MDNNKEIEQDGEKAAVADNDTMVVDNNTEVEMEMTGGKGEKEFCDDSLNQSMEVDNERPTEAKDEDLGQRKEEEEGNETVETEPNNNGKVNSNKSVDYVANRSVEEKGSVGNPPANESTRGEILVMGNQLEDSVLVEEKDEKPKELNNDAAGMELSVQDGAKKEEFSNGLIPEQLNGAKEEALKNEVKMAKVEDPKRGVTGGQTVVFDGTKGEPATQVKEKLLKPEPDRAREVDVKTPTKSFLYDTDADGYESGTEEEQVSFIKELELFHRERGLDFKPPKFYQEKLNLLK